MTEDSAAEEDAPMAAEVGGHARRAAFGASWLPGPARLISQSDVLALSASGRAGRGESLEVISASVGSAPVPRMAECVGSRTALPSVVQTAQSPSCRLVLRRASNGRSRRTSRRTSR